MDSRHSDALNSTLNDSSVSSSKEFLAFKRQLEVVQSRVDECNIKIVDKSLCSEDLTDMEEAMDKMKILEKELTPEKMKSNYVSYKAVALKMVQESFRICNWLLEKQNQEIDNIFDIDSFVDLIFKDCDSSKDPFDHMNKLFKGVLTNTEYFNLNFFSNLKLEESDKTMAPTQLKREYRKSQKRQLEDQIVPVEVENDAGDNELKKTLGRIKVSLKRAVRNNGGKSVPFYKFAIDPFSMSNSVENLFHLASLAKDQIVKIERVMNGDDVEFSTIALGSKSSSTSNSKNQDDFTFLMTINHDLWQHYIKKYKITERMIEQDDE